MLPHMAGVAERLGLTHCTFLCTECMLCTIGWLSARLRVVSKLGGRLEQEQLLSEPLTQMP